LKMTRSDKNTSDTEIETLFAAARSAPPTVPDALMASILADAGQMQPAQPTQGGVFSWLRALGGGPGVGGLVFATCVGFWIGVAPPANLPDLAGQLLNLQSSTDIDDSDLTGFGWDIEEG
jgi:hypothetical protein